MASLFVNAGDLPKWASDVDKPQPTLQAHPIEELVTVSFRKATISGGDVCLKKVGERSLFEDADKKKTNWNTDDGV